MSKLINTFFFLLQGTFILYGQNNTIVENDFLNCGQHIIHNKHMNSPEAIQKRAVYEEQIRQLIHDSVPLKSGTIYQIPIVFHVLHNNGVENISRQQVLDVLAILNRDFRLQNSDANDVVYDFNAANPSAVCQPSDVEIEFVLATKAPDGSCFGGITRTMSPLTYTGSNGDLQVDEIIAKNDVYNGPWPGNRYMNVFICANLGGPVGYAEYPYDELGQEGMYAGIFVRHDYIGSIGTSSDLTSRALTHEVGHWLNLYHPWGNNDTPGNVCGTDEVEDTPQTRGVISCNLNENFCGELANVENYMDYSFCSKMFTAGQVERMRAAVISPMGGRNNLWTPSNLALTGADGSASICKAEFTANRTDICAGEQIQFSDESFNNVSSRQWTFAGGTPSTSTDLNPFVTFNAPGTYTVSLTVSDGTNSLSQTKTGFIKVLPNARTLPYFEGFEGITDLNNSDYWTIKNFNQNNSWEISSLASHSGAKSATIENFNEEGGSIDELISPTIDLSGITSTTGATLSFRYAHRKRVSSNTEYLNVFASFNCGESWIQRKSMVNSSLSNLTDTAFWVPESVDWSTMHITNITSLFWSEDFRFKFSFESDLGNNLYIDDINLYSGGPSDDLILGVTNSISSLENVSIYPVPSANEVTLSFSTSTSENFVIELTDLLGKKMEQYQIISQPGKNEVIISTDQLSSGTYFLSISNGTYKSSFKIIQTK